jgi:hypothetical protein
MTTRAILLATALTTGFAAPSFAEGEAIKIAINE